LSIWDETRWGQNTPDRNTVATLGKEITFASAINQVGFNFGGNTANNVDLSFYSGSTLIDSATLTNDLVSNNWIFNGFETGTAFDRLVFGPETNSNFAYGLYDLKYAASEAPAVPLPAGLVFVLGGFGMFGCLGRRKSTT
jgi:hypothetical protein